MKQIYLIRHGQYYKQDWTHLAVGYSFKTLLLKTDGALTKKGKDQAHLTAKRFENIKIDAIHCSSLQRTQETKAPFSKCLPVQKGDDSELLWECVPTRPQEPSEDVSRLSLEEIESSRKKADEAFETYFQPAEAPINEIIICHGNLIRYFVCKALKLPVETWTQMEILNCGVTQIAIGNNETRLVSLNDSGHLPESMKTYT